MKDKRKYLLFFIIFVIYNLIISFLHVPLLNKISLVMLGIFFNIVIYKLIFFVLKHHNIYFNNKDKLLVAVFTTLLFAIYVLLIFIRNDIYVWDNSVYYGNINSLNNDFNISIFNGYKNLILDSISNDYGNYLIIFLYPFYMILPKSIKFFQISYFISSLIPIIILLYSLGIKLLNKTDSNSLINKISILVFVTTFPMLHIASILGRPDIFGFIFILLLILLTIDYNFDNIDYKRYMYIIFTTISLLLTRRWYIYFVFSYYLFYTLGLIYISIRDGNNHLYKRIKNILLLYLIIFSVIISFGLPKVINITSTNYELLYSVYSFGGLKYELINKINNIGIIFILIMLVGFIYSIINKKTRYFSLILFGTYLLSIILFIRIQNLDIHHNLIIIIMYIYCLYNFIIIKLKNDKVMLLKNSLLIILSIICLLNSSLFNTKNTMSNKLFGNLKVYPERRKDLDKINRVLDFVNEEETIVLQGINVYDCSTFINYPEPFSNNNIHSTNYLYNDGFPLEFFTSRYYIIIDPTDEWDGIKKAKVLDNILDLFYNNKYISNKFRLRTTIELENGYKAIIYERVKEVDDKEIDIFIDKFSINYDDFNKLFRDRLLDYKTYYKDG